MSELEDELQSLTMKLNIIWDKMNADYDNKIERLKWYKEYLIVRQRINAINIQLYKIEQLVKKLDESPKVILIKEEAEKEKSFWNKIIDWWVDEK
jgi:hypothetical protein